MKTLNQINLLLKSEPGDIEATDPNAKKPVFEDVSDPTEYLSQHAQAWMLNPTNTQAREALANNQHPIPREQREKILQRLAQLTNVRVNPVTKDREFLLHRGVSEDEKKGVVSGNLIHHSEASSWTPAYHVAHGFAAENMSLDRKPGNRSNILNEAHKNVLSAWIPEHSIATMPAQHLTAKQRRDNPMVDEHEVVVRPNHVSEVADKKFRPVHAVSEIIPPVSKNPPIKLQKAEPSAFPTWDLKTKSPKATAETPVSPSDKIAMDAAIANAKGGTKPPSVQPSAQTAPIPPEQRKKWGKLAGVFEERRKQEHEQKRKNMEEVTNPGATAIHMDEKSQYVMPDEMHAASLSNPATRTQLKNGLFHSTVSTADGSKVYHFLSVHQLDHNFPIAGLVLSRTPEGYTITKNWTKNSHAGQRAMPVLFKYAAKHHKVDKLNVPELDAVVHGVGPFKTHNPEVIQGLRPTVFTQGPLGGITGATQISNREGTKKAISKPPLDVKNLMNYDDMDEQGKKEQVHWTDPNFTTSHREAAYDKMARDFFGLGEFIPKTTVFTNPVTGNVHSAQAWANNANTQPTTSEIQAGTSDTDLQKIALMDTILGNSDRHGGNMMTDHNGKIILIDHGLTFDIPDADVTKQRAGGNYPTKVASKTRKGVLTPETLEWVKNLNPEDMVMKLKASGVPDALAGRVVNRLKKLKQLIPSTPMGKLVSFVKGENPGFNWLSSIIGHLEKVGNKV